MLTLKSFRKTLILLPVLLVLCSCAGPTPEAATLVVPSDETQSPEATAVPTKDTVPPALSETDVYSVPSVDICPMIQDLASQALGVEFTLESPAPFVDEIAGEGGQGCLISASGDESQLGSPQAVIASLLNSAGLGWNEQINYQADGPTGSSTAVTRDMTLMIFNAGWQSPESASCSVDQPVSSCDSTPEQKMYTVTINVAEFKADFSLDGFWVDSATGFTLELYQDWKNVYGQHTVVAQNGAKIDSLEASINGMLSGKVATVQFQSSFTNQPGTAEITYIDVNTIQWKIVSPPDGEYYLPAEATLTR